MAAVVPAHAPMQALLAKYGKRLFGVESRRPLNEFDVLGFSLSYELGGTNILEMLRQAGVPVTWEASRAVHQAAGLGTLLAALLGCRVACAQLRARQGKVREGPALRCGLLARSQFSSRNFTWQRGPAFSDWAPPPTEQERKEEAGKPWDPAKGSWPLIFAGGPTATSNPGVLHCLLQGSMARGVPAHAGQSSVNALLRGGDGTDAAAAHLHAAGRPHSTAAQSTAEQTHL